MTWAAWRATAQPGAQRSDMERKDLRVFKRNWHAQTRDSRQARGNRVDPSKPGENGLKLKRSRCVAVLGCTPAWPSSRGERWHTSAHGGRRGNPTCMNRVRTVMGEGSLRDVRTCPAPLPPEQHTHSAWGYGASVLGPLFGARYEFPNTPPRARISDEEVSRRKRCSGISVKRSA